MSNKKVIDYFDIMIGQDAFRSIEPMLIFAVNNRTTTVLLKDFKKWIDIIVESNGDRSEKAYEAFYSFRSVFSEIFHPFMNYKNINNSEKIRNKK